MRLHSSFPVAAPALCGHFLSQKLKATLSLMVSCSFSAAVLPQLIGIAWEEMRNVPKPLQEEQGQSSLILLPPARTPQAVLDCKAHSGFHFPVRCPLVSVLGYIHG